MATLFLHGSRVSGPIDTSGVWSLDRMGVIGSTQALEGAECQTGTTEILASLTMFRGFWFDILELDAEDDHAEHAFELRHHTRTLFTPLPILRLDGQAGKLARRNFPSQLSHPTIAAIPRYSPFPSQKTVSM
jgi:hypothetical protein